MLYYYWVIFQWNVHEFLEGLNSSNHDFPMKTPSGPHPVTTLKDRPAKKGVREATSINHTFFAVSVTSPCVILLLSYFSMKCPWVSGGFKQFKPWFSHENTIFFCIFPWFSNIFSMNIPWISHAPVPRRAAEVPRGPPRTPAPPARHGGGWAAAFWPRFQMKVGPDFGDLFWDVGGIYPPVN